MARKEETGSVGEGARRMEEMGRREKEGGQARTLRLQALIKRTIFDPKFLNVKFFEIVPF